jgi:spermidine synthase
MRGQPDRLLPLAVGICGGAGIFAQTILMRELVVAFYGNELTTGFLLGVWLLGTAFGSGVLGRAPILQRNALLSFARAQVLAGILMPVSVVLVRLSPPIFGRTPGEISDLVPMFLTPLLWVFPFCVVIGFLFTAGVRAFEEAKGPGTAAGRIGWIYFAESLGAGIGGLVVSFLLLRWLSNLSIVALASASLLGTGARFLRRLEHRRSALVSGGLAVAALVLPLLERPTLRLLWRGLEVTEVGNSVYGQTVVTRLGGSISFYVNGLLMFTWPDYLTAEQTAHPPLLEHPAPKDVLLIGGGAGGLLAEVLKHPTVRHVDYVELDPTVIRLARKTLPDSVVSLLEDPRVATHHLDGRRFLRITPRRYDVILLNLPDPHNVQVNRFYTVQFFREARRKLAPGGLLAFQVNSSENAIGPDLAEFLRCLEASLAHEYRRVVLLPGESTTFLASTDGALSAEADTLLGRLRSRGIPATYVREYYLPYQLTRERKLYLAERLRAAGNPGLNLDLRPVAYYFDVTLWSTLFTQSLRNLLRFLRVHGRTLLGGAAFLGMAACLILGLAEWRRTGDLRRMPVLVTILSVGFAEISLEVASIVAFQALFGYAYYELALLVAAYMIGLTCGSFFGTRAVQRGGGARARAVAVQLGFLLLVLGFFEMLRQASTTAPQDTVSQWLKLGFPLAVGLAGAAGGYQFPVANAILLGRRERAREAAGLLYGIDLVGSSAGALLTSTFVIPLMGVQNTLLGLALLNGFSLLFLMVSWTSRRQWP